MGIIQDKNRSASTSSSKPSGMFAGGGSQEQQRTRSLVWLHVGVFGENGKFYGNPVGMPIDTQKPFEGRNLSEDYQMRNAVLSNLQEIGNRLGEGEEEFIGLSGPVGEPGSVAVQIRRVRPREEQPQAQARPAFAGFASVRLGGTPKPAEVNSGTVVDDIPM